MNIEKIRFIPKEISIPWTIMLVFPNLDFSDEAIQHIGNEATQNIHPKKNIKFIRRWDDMIIEVEVIAESSEQATNILKSCFKKELPHYR